jgi:hypothetical protein
MLTIYLFLVQRLGIRVPISVINLLKWTLAHVEKRGNNQKRQLTFQTFVILFILSEIHNAYVIQAWYLCYGRLKHALFAVNADHSKNIKERFK